MLPRGTCDTSWPAAGAPTPNIATRIRAFIFLTRLRQKRPRGRRARGAIEPNELEQELDAEPSDDRRLIGAVHEELRIGIHQRVGLGLLNQLIEIQLTGVDLRLGVIARAERNGAVTSDGRHTVGHNPLVEEIEHVHAQLQPAAAAHLEIVLDVEVHLREDGRPAVAAASEIPERLAAPRDDRHLTRDWRAARALLAEADGRTEVEHVGTGQLQEVRSEEHTSELQSPY